MRKLVRCHAEGKDGAWEAVCLDFDLAVQGETFEQVYRGLNESIEAYCEYVSALPQKERDAFWNRKAPPAMRWRFLWHAVRGLYDGGDPRKSRHDYTALCAA